LGLVLAVSSLSIANSLTSSTPAEAAPSLTSAELLAGATSTQGLYVKGYQNGQFAVFLNNQPQFFAGSPRADEALRGMSNGTDWYINGTDYYVPYLAGNSAYVSSNSDYGTLKRDSATLSQPASDTLRWVWEQDNLIFEQTLTLRSGSRTLERTWGITNKTGSTITGGKLFSGGDTYFDGNDWGYAGHSNPLDMTYVYRDAAAGLMAFRGSEDTPADGYYGGAFTMGWCYMHRPDMVATACAGIPGGHQLPNTVSGPDSNRDQEVYLQWNMPDIAPEGSYTMAGEITFEPPGQLFVLGESMKSVQPGQTVTKSFVLVNVGTAALQANLTVESSQGWTAQVASPVTVPPNGGDGVLVPVQLTVPATAAHGDEDTLTVTATYTPTGQSGTLTRSGVARTRVYDPQIVIEPYAGTYDGQAHDAIEVLTLEGVDVLADDARPKQYSTDGGTTWSPTMPSFTDAGIYPIKIQVAGAELPTVEIPAMVIIGLQTLTVSIGDVALYAGETPTYTLTYSGWIGNETATTAAGFEAPTVTTAYDPANALVDVYDLELTGGDADNYVFSLGGQPQLTVSPAVTLDGDGLLSGTAGQTTSHTFTLVNHSSLDRSVTVASTSDHGWAVSLRGPTTVTVPADGSTTLLVDELVPAAALKNTRDKVTLTATYAIGTAAYSLTAEAETGVGTTPPDVGSSTLTVVKNNADADDIDVNTVRAIVRNAGGEPLDGIAVDFTWPAGVKSGATEGPGQVQVVTDALGRADLNLTSLIGDQAFSIGATIASLNPGDLTPVTVTFTPLPPVLEPQFSSFDVSTAAVKADGVGAVTVSVVLKNRLGAPVTGQEARLAFDATGGGNLKGDFQEGPAGTYQAALRSTQSGDKTVTATFGGLSVPLKTGGNDIAHFLSVSPASSVTVTPADGSEPVYVDESWRITVRPVTPTGDPVSGLKDVTVSIDPKVAVTAVAEISPGVYEALATTTAAGSYEVQASADGVTLSQRPEITFLGGPDIDPSRSTLTVTPTTQTAGSAIQATIRARDKYDNPVTDLTSLTTDVTGHAVAPTVAPDISATPSTFVNKGDGVYTLDITSTKAGDFLISGTARGTDLAQHPAVTFTAGAVSADHTWAQVIKPSALADGIDKVQVKVHAADTYDNPVTGARVIGSRYNNTALNPDPNQVTTGSNGEALLEWTSQVPGTYTATITVDGVTQFSGSTQNQLAFTTGDADPGTSLLEVRPTLSTDADPIVAGHSYTATVTLLNGRRQPVVGDVVTFDITEVDGYKPTLSAVTCTSRTDGTCEIQVMSTKAADFDLSARIQSGGSLKDVQHSPATLTWRPDAVCVPPEDGTCSEDPTKRTRVEVTKDNQLADGVARDEATLYAFDRFGNPVPGAAWVSTTSDSSLTIATPSGSTGPTGTSVISYTSIVQGSHPAGVAVAGKALPTILLSFTNVPWAKATLAVAPAYAQPVDSHFILTATIEAAGGLPINGASVTLTSPSPDLSFVGGPTCATDAQGRCTVQVTSTKSGRYEVGFAGSPAAQVVGSPATVEFEAGPIDATRSYVEVIVNGAKPYNRLTDQDIVKVVVQDRYGNPVIGATAGSSVADNRVTVLSNAIAPTDSNGTTQIGYTASAAGTYQAHVTVTKNGQTITPSRSPVDLIFSEVVIDTSQSTWTLTPKTALVVGTEAANAFTATVTARDATGELAVGGVVSFQIDPVEGPTWGLGLSSCTTNNQGQCSVTVSSTKAGSYAVTARAQGEPIGEAQPAVWNAGEVCGVECDPETPDPTAWSRVAVTRNNAPADGSSADVVTVWAFDKWGNPVPEQPVSSNTANPDLRIEQSPAPTGNGQNGTTRGVATISYYSQVTGTYEVTDIKVAGKTPRGLPVSLTFVPGCIPGVDPNCPDDPNVPNEKRTHLEVTRNNQAANGTARDEVTLFLFDQRGNAVGTQQVASESLNGQVTVVQPVAPTNGQGRSAIEYTSTALGSHQVAVRVYRDGVWRDVTFVPQPGSTPPASYVSSPATISFGNDCIPGLDPGCTVNPEVDNEHRSRVVVDPDNQKANGTDRDIATVYLFDAGGHPVAGAEVSSTSATAGLTIQPAATIGQTDANGQTTIWYSSTVEGQASARAYFQIVGRAEQGEVTFTPQPGSTPPASYQSSPFVLSFADATSPAAPVILQPTEGAHLNDNTPTVSGTGQPGASLSVTEGARTIGTVTVPGDGSWTLTSPQLADGPHEFKAVQSDNAGASPEAVRHFTVDTTPPAPPQVITPQAGAVINNENGQEVAGHAEPGTTVTVRGEPGPGNGPGTVLCSAQTDGQGNWSCQIPSDRLPGEGPHTIVADATDQAGNVSDATQVPYTVDNSRPETCAQNPSNPNCFAIVRPAEGATVADATPTFAGTGEPGTTVTIKEGAGLLCTTTVASDGQWSCDSTSTLVDGPHSVIGQSTDAAGNASAPVTRSFRIDSNTPPVCEEVDPDLCTDPNALRIDRPREGEAVGTARVQFDGHGLPSATVQVMEGDTLLCSTTVAVNNTWSCTSTVALPDGAHRVQATQTNTAGTTSAPYVRNFSVDTTRPVTCVEDPGNPFCFDIIQPAEGSTVPDATPTFSGSGEPGTTVTVKEGSALLCQATVTVGGTWSCDSTRTLADGSHFVVGQATDAAGNVSAPVTRSFMVDPNVPPTCEFEDPALCTDPNALRIDRPTEGQAVNTPRVRFEGHGLPTATVQVVEGSTLLCTTTVAADNTWSCTSAPALPDGAHRVEATQTSVAGLTSAPYVRNFLVDTVRPVTCAEDPSAPNCFDITRPAEGSTIPDLKPVFEGTGEPGATVEVKDDRTGEQLCSTVVGAEGRWTCTSTTALPEGDNKVKGTITDPAGNVSAPVEREFTVDPNTPPTCEETDPELCTDPNALRIDRPTEGQAVNTPKVRFEGHGLPTATVRVVEGNALLCSTTVAADNTWSCTSSAALPDGAHRVQATQTSAAGLTSKPYVRNFTVDTVAPVTCAEDPSAPNCFDITRPGEGDHVNDSTPVFEGTGEPGGSVQVVDEATGDLLCSTTVAENGRWTCESTTALPDGDRTVTGWVTDPAGNESDEVQRHFQVDTVPPTVCPEIDPEDCTEDPTALRIDRPRENQQVNTPRVVFEGHGEPDATVEVKEGDVPLCTTTVKPDYTWVCTSSVSLADGGHVASATQADKAGNVSSPYVRNFGVDTHIDPPIVTKPGQGEAINNELGQEVAGSAEPGSTVRVEDEGSGEELCTAQADATGRWSCEVPADKRPGEGDHTLVVTAEDPAGNVSDSTRVDYVVDTTGPAVKIVSPAAGEDVPAGYPDRPLVVSGIGETAGDQIVVSDSRGNRCTTEVQFDLTWSCTYHSALPEGPTTITATATDRAGNTGSDHRDIMVDRTAPDAPKVNEPIDGSYVNNDRPQVAGEGDPGDTIKVVDEAGRALCDAVPVQGDGTWFCTASESLPEGNHELTVTATDPAGNVSERTVVEITVDTTAPDRPIVTRPSEGAVINERQVWVEGTAEPGAKVRVEAAPDNICTAVVDASGHFSCQLPKPLPDGPARIVVVAMDSAGNVSEPTEVHFRVDTEAPTPPSVDTRDPEEITGKTDPDTAVEIQDDEGQTICQTVSDKDGNWWCRPNQPLRPGDEITVIARDEAGNSSSVTVRILSVRVDKPILAAGEEQTARGFYFHSGERVHGLWWVDGQAVDLGWRSANGLGEVTFTWQIPAATSRHLFEVDLVGDVSGPGTAVFQVTDPLPATGSPVGVPFVVGAGLATLVGMWFLVVAWRRRRSEESVR
jgi:hypothetical protein